MTGMNPTRPEMERLKDVFREVKAEKDKVLSEPDSNAFVHTRVYRSVLDARRCLLIGGKGSGKTALLLGYRNENQSHFLTTASIDIKADDFPLEALFSFFYSDLNRSEELVRARLKFPTISDLPAFVDPVRISAYAWTQSLKCASIFIVAKILLSRKVEIGDVNVKKLKKAIKAIGRHMGISMGERFHESGAEVVFSLLIYFFQSVQGVIDTALNTHTHEIAVLLAAITLRVTRKLSAGLEKSVEEAARIIGDVLDENNKKVLITLDKFDDFYDEFFRRSRGSVQLAERRDFLAALLQGLIIAARDLNQDPRFKWLDILFTIPMDKFLELHLRERVEFEQLYVLRLDWTPKELLEYVNRRIAYALNLPSEKKDEAWKTLFPFEVTNGTVKNVKEDSFLYLIRHSQWKPREIQMYLTAILTLMDERRTAADEDMFRRAVKAESERIIQREFIEEFSGEYPGLAKVLKKLENIPLKTVVSYEDLCNKLSGSSVFEYDIPVDELMKRLFHIGILGTRQVFQSKKLAAGDPTLTQNKEIVSYRYCYNCRVNEPFTQDTLVSFHPMFFEFLDIRHEEDYVVNQLKWEMFRKRGPSS